ncbi:MAG: helix-turn-helix transcriptional regulator [Candidatus Heimdallarchaeota archaeon]|nr:helix-turn-helix transcriptional regulator [Candidatus Heimdallarchaeota archaeon]MCK4253959.1 helix-turn-helix transcriptional regulator [Candidatus Heimdallarchaeota archaeon]
MTASPEENSVLKPEETKAYQRLEKNFTIDLLWIWVLKLLREGPKYAYELRQEIQNKFGFSPATVTNYTILYLLEREGVVEKVEKRNSDERIDRKYYAITDLGEKLMDTAETYLRTTINKLFQKSSSSK